MNSYVMVLPVTGNIWRVFELMREENVTGFWTGGDGVDLLQWFIEQGFLHDVSIIGKLAGCFVVLKVKNF
ncbi:hypothetical protein AB3S75_028466 [Citrus x aurantiifolia]